MNCTSVIFQLILKIIKNNFFAISALFLSLYNFLKAMPKLNIYFSDEMYKIASMTFLNNQNNIIKKNLERMNVYLLHFTIRNYSTSDHYIPKIHLNGGNGEDINKFAPLDLILSSNNNVLLNLQENSFGVHYMNFIPHNHFLVKGSSLLEVNLLIEVPHDVRYIEIKVETANETLGSRLSNISWISRLLKLFNKKPERVHKFIGYRYHI